jgi:hypothetical protein
MGFLTRRLVPRSVRRAAHPVRTVKRAATPKVVKKARRSLHPVSNAVYGLERSIPTGRSRRKRARRKAAATARQPRPQRAARAHRAPRTYTPPAPYAPRPKLTGAVIAQRAVTTGAVLLGAFALLGTIIYAVQSPLFLAGWIPFWVVVIGAEYYGGRALVRRRAGRSAAR